MISFAKHPFARFALASALLIVALYSPLFHSQFVYDDNTLVAKNPTLSHWPSLLAYFRTATPFGGDFGDTHGTYYRPLTWLSFGLDRWLWGLNPVGFHCTNLFLHWLNGLLAFTLLRRLGLRVGLSVFVVGLWLMLPINSEAVAWISARTYPLTFCFILAALLAAESYFRTRKPLPLAMFFVSTEAAAFSHEVGMVVLPLTFLIRFTRSKDSSGAGLRPAAAFQAALLADIIYYAARYLAGGSPPALHILPANFGQYVLTYISWFFFPIQMSVERSTDTPANGQLQAIVITLLVAAVWISSLFFLRKRIPTAAAALTWTTITLFPLCGFIYVYQGMAERYLYIPSAGLCLAITALVARTPKPARSFLAVTILFWLLWSAPRTFNRGFDWTNERALFTSSLQADPRSWVLWLNLGNVDLQSGDASRAIDDYNAALHIKPDAVKATVNLASALQLSGNSAAAEEEYRRALQLDPDRSTTYSDFAVLLFNQHRWEEAERLLTRAVALDAANATAWFDLGVLYAHEGKRTDAGVMYHRALDLVPDYPDAKRALDALQK